MTDLQVSTTVGLAVLLTYEHYHMGEASKYHKYLASLPKGFGTVQYWQEEELSFKHFSWAVGNVFARSLLLSIEDTGSMVPVLLPGFDEFELTIQNASKITLENDTVVLKSLTGAKAGNSLFVNNGYKGNDGLLLNHGTYVESNPYDGVPMNIRMSRDDPLYDTKDKMIKTLGMNVDTPFRLMANANGTVPAAMLRSLRVQLMRFK